MSKNPLLGGLLVLTILLTMSFFVNVPAVSSSPLSTEWSKRYSGATAIDGWPYIVIQTSDGGYAIAGRKATAGANNFAFWLIKTDPTGNMQWNRTYGGSSYSKVFNLIQTNDGGYALVGDTWAYSGWYDAWLVKTDAQGNMQWNKVYGGSGVDTFSSVIQTSDGGYALVGETTSKGAGYYDFWFVKTNSSGDVQWDRTYGGADAEVAQNVVKTDEGGYVLSGGTRSFARPGDVDLWMVKTDAEGNMQWNRTYGGNNEEDWGFVVPTSDGGYAIAGYTQSYGAGNSDFWLVKTDSFGNTQWNKTYGGMNNDRTKSMVQTSGMGFVLAGRTDSFGAGGNDFWLIETDDNGDMLWNKTFGGTGDDVGWSVAKTIDGGLAFVGYTNSFSGDGSYQVWLIKLSSSPETPIQPTLTVSCRSSTSYTAFKVEINGNLAKNGAGFSGVPIALSYSVTGGNSWIDLTLVNTGSDGSFSAVWMPSVTGSYLIKASWNGNATYSGVSTIVNLAVMPLATQNVFSVASNSTVSGLAFNSASRKLSFTVTGPSGTTGYVDVYIAKTLVDDIAKVKAHIDGNEINYTATSTDDSWLLHFTYQHSAHNVVISLETTATQPDQTSTNNYWIYGLFIAIILILAVSLVVVWKKRSKKS